MYLGNKQINQVGKMRLGRYVCHYLLKLWETPLYLCKGHILKPGRLSMVLKFLKRS